jgi:hypothetical protein
MVPKFVGPLLRVFYLPMRGIGTDIFQGHGNVVGFQKTVYCQVIKNMRLIKKRLIKNMRLPFVSLASPNDTDEESTVVYNRATRGAVPALQSNDSAKASVTWGGQLDVGFTSAKKGSDVASIVPPRGFHSPSWKPSVVTNSSCWGNDASPICPLFPRILR